jgi:hypothetical protein
VKKTDDEPGADEPAAARRPSLLKAARVPAAPEVPLAPGGPPPTQVRLVALALVIGAIGTASSAASLLGLRTWLTHSVKQSQKNAKPKDKLSGQALYDHVTSVMRGQLVAGVVLAVVLIIVAVCAYRGRPWTRWAVIGLFVIASFTGTEAGISSILSVGTSEPLAFKATAFVAGLAMLVSCVLVMMRPSVQFFNANKPERPGRPGRPVRPGSPGSPGSLGRPGRPGQATAAAPRPSLRDMFAPRARPAPSPPPTRGDRPTPNTAAAGRAKAKVRTDAEAVAKGAELARNRAKTSKSRRTDV